MKLNLLPTYVSKEKVTRSALLLSVAIFAVFIVLAFLMYTKATRDFEASKDGIPQLRAAAAKAKATSDAADALLNKPSTVGLLRNTHLAQAMLAHNDTYPKLYDHVRQYIPSFYRINSISAAAAGPTSTAVTMVGVLDSYQQYADLMLALLRMGPEVQSISRSGFVNNSPYVPGLTDVDQVGRPRKPGEAPIPDDPLKRLDYFESQGRVTGYQGVGGFGSGAPGTRGAMPTQSLVTVTIVLADDLQTPDPRATLAGGGGAAPGGGSGGPGATSGITPKMGGGGASAPAPAPSTGGGAPKGNPPSTSAPRGRGNRRGTIGEEDQ